jgi:hypothetical protein
MRKTEGRRHEERKSNPVVPVQKTLLSPATGDNCATNNYERSYCENSI